MSNEREPWFPCYADAYMADKDLEGVSCVAETMLVRMMMLSHNGEPYGYITNGGKAMTKHDIAKTKSAAVVDGKVTIKELEDSVDELLDAHRIGFDEESETYFVPKMARIGATKEKYREYGKRGGNPNLKKKKPKVKRPPKGGDKAGVKPEDKDFDEFWSAYPRKEGMGNAKKAWEQTKEIRPPINELIAIINKQASKSGWQKDGGQFIPHPGTWLRQERWTDEVDPSTAPGYDKWAPENLKDDPLLGENNPWEMKK